MGDAVFSRDDFDAMLALVDTLKGDLREMREERERLRLTLLGAAAQFEGYAKLHARKGAAGEKKRETNEYWAQLLRQRAGVPDKGAPKWEGLEDADPYLVGAVQGLEEALASGENQQGEAAVFVADCVRDVMLIVRRWWSVHPDARVQYLVRGMVTITALVLRQLMHGRYAEHAEAPSKRDALAVFKDCANWLIWDLALFYGMADWLKGKVKPEKRLLH